MIHFFLKLIQTFFSRNAERCCAHVFSSSTSTTRDDRKFIQKLHIVAKEHVITLDTNTYF